MKEDKEDNKTTSLQRSLKPGDMLNYVGPANKEEILLVVGVQKEKDFAVNKIKYITLYWKSSIHSRKSITLSDYRYGHDYIDEYFLRKDFEIMNE